MLRTAKALAYINQEGFVTVTQLCGEFGISESTARRLLTGLAEQRLVQRVHGGAAALERSRSASMVIRQNTNRETKQRIAQKACGIINEDSTLILMGGTNVAAICPFIKNMRLTVITNSFLVFNALQYSSTVRLIFLGGLFNPQEYEVGGVLANQGLRFIRADYLFMGAASFDERSGFITATPAVELYISCMEISSTVCVLVDSSKYHSGGVGVTAKPNNVHYLFTDTGLPAEAIEQFKSTGMRIVLAEKA